MTKYIEQCLAHGQYYTGVCYYCCCYYSYFISDEAEAQWGCMIYLKSYC